MSGNSPTAANEDEKPKVEFNFCRECSNLLYPKEDPTNNVLMFACRTCQFSEPAATACIFKNDLNTTVGETAGITQDVASDPTVGDLPAFCTMCGTPIMCEVCEAEPVEGFVIEAVDMNIEGPTKMSTNRVTQNGGTSSHSKPGDADSDSDSTS